MFQQEEFNKFVLEHNVIGFYKEPVKFKSGRLSHNYVNWRTVAEDVRLLEQLAEFVISFTKSTGLNPDSFFGVPEGATKLGLLTQYLWAKQQESYGEGSHVISMGRADAKKHGVQKDKDFLGYPKGRTIVVEDTTTTGGSLIRAIKNLQEAGVDVVAAFVLTDRMELTDNKTVKQTVEETGVKYHAMSRLSDLLPAAFKKLNPGEGIGKAVEEYFDKYGEKNIKL